jgi:FAD/FMN-containing dehydrogenase
MLSGVGAISRRELLARAGALGAAMAMPAVLRLDPADAAAGCPPPNFPSGIELYKQGFENWSGEVVVEDLWTCSPAAAADVVGLANWALRNGWRLRPRGRMHTWAPLTVTTRSGCAEQVVLVDLTRHFAAIETLDGARVRVGTGATVETLLAHLEARGLGITGIPATGDITVGGALAIGAHGASLPALGEEPAEGHTYGSMSNLVLSLEALVWDRKSRRYRLRSFDRSHPDCAAFLAHLGRAFVTEVTLRVGANSRIRCQSYLDIPGRQLFAAPGAGGGQRFSDFLDATGRAESIWFPFTDSPWLKVWSVAPRKPAGSREVTAPYNYPFSHTIPVEVAKLADRIVTGDEAVTPLFGATMHAVASAGTLGTDSRDIWGWSRTTQLYITASTLRVAESGLAILTSRANAQTVLSEIAAYWRRRMDELAAQRSYPMNMPLELRVCGIDRPADVRHPHARAPALSPMRGRPDRPDWDVVVWANALTFPDTTGSWAYYAELESFCARRFSGGDALHRPEWSKGWGYTPAGPWTAAGPARRAIRRGWRTGYGDRGWDWATRTLASYDPYELFTNGFTRTLFAPRRH